MATRAVWKRQLRRSLVSIPVGIRKSLDSPGGEPATRSAARAEPRKSA